MRPTILFAALLIACGGESLTMYDDGSTTQPDASVEPDSEIHESPDAWVHPGIDSGSVDLGTKPSPDMGVDSGIDQSLPDSSIPDSYVQQDTFSQPDQWMAPDQAVTPDLGADQGVADLGVAADQGTAADAFVQPCIHPPVKKNCNNGWCTIPAGCFEMMAQGSGNPPCSNKKWREVRITHSFVISQHETTRGEHWSRTSQGCYGSISWSSGITPAVNVPAAAAENYCNQLSAYENREQCYSCTASSPSCGAVCVPVKDPHKCKGYRLPTEAEWEYAYRAGTQTDYHNGDISTCKVNIDANVAKIAWYNKLSMFAEKKCQLQQNGWGLCDMSGNVQEWTYDNFVPSPGSVPLENPVGPTNLRGMRGGHHKDYAWRVMGASRVVSDPALPPAIHYGYRCVRTL